MKFIINGRFFEQKLTGVQRYASETVAPRGRHCDKMEIEIAVPQGTKAPSFRNIPIRTVGKRHGVLWEQLDFASYVRKQKSVSVNLCNSAPFFGNNSIVCIHDVKIKAYPQFFRRKFRLWYSVLFAKIIRNACKVLTVSEFSKREIVKYYRCDPEKICVIYNAWQHYCSVSENENALEKFNLKENEYAFALGSLEPNKNLKWIFEVAKRNPSMQFAIGGGINPKIFSEDQTKIPANVSLLGYLCDQDAKCLMRHCRVFLFPSFYEGFGIPPMEAMVAGAANIVVSDIPVMHEIFGDAVYYADPSRYEYHINDMISDRRRYADVLSRYSWDSSAQKLWMLFHEMMQD